MAGSKVCDAEKYIRKLKEIVENFGSIIDPKVFTRIRQSVGTESASNPCGSKARGTCG